MTKWKHVICITPHYWTDYATVQLSTTLFGISAKTPTLIICELWICKLSKVTLPQCHTNIYCACLVEDCGPFLDFFLLLTTSNHLKLSQRDEYFCFAHLPVCSSAMYICVRATYSSPTTRDRPTSAYSYQGCQVNYETCLNIVTFRRFSCKMSSN